MSGFYNGTNARRVERAIEFLDMIEKSAQSNRATNEDLRRVLAPLMAKLEELGALGPSTAPPAPSTPAAPRPVINHPYGSLSDVRARIENLDTRGLLDLMGVVTAELERNLDP